jgi:uncharacterized protein (TIGR03067 family)
LKEKLPSRPNLDHLRRQAKTLLSELHEGDTEAARLFIEHLPEAKKLSPARVRARGFRLADAQSAIARKTGFANWPSLSPHVHNVRALEGDWRFERLEVDGNSVPKAALGHSRILIDGDCFRTESPEGNYDGVFTIDVEAEPPRIDIEFVEGPEAGNRSYGIYELKGDRVVFCLGLVGSSRPEGFVTAKGSGHALEELRRESSARPAGVAGGKRDAHSKPIAAAREAASVDVPLADPAVFDGGPTPALEWLAGEWKALELIRDGQKMQDDWLAYGTRTNTGNETKVVFAGQTMLHAKMRIDEKAKPMAIDYLNLTGAQKGRVSLGILERKGDEVSFNTAPPGKPRPTDFVSAKRSLSTLSRWRRVT